MTEQTPNRCTCASGREAVARCPSHTLADYGAADRAIGRAVPSDDPLADLIAAHRLTTPVQCACGDRFVAPGEDWAAHVAAVVRASGAGLGGTNREQSAQDARERARQAACPACELPGGLVVNLAHPDAPAVSCGICGAALMLVPVHPDPAPDDTTDLRAEDRYAGMDASDAIRLVAVNRIRELTIERDAARADLAALREGIEREAASLDFAWPGQARRLRALLDA